MPDQTSAPDRPAKKDPSLKRLKELVAEAENPTMVLANEIRRSSTRFAAMLAEWKALEVEPDEESSQAVMVSMRGLMKTTARIRTQFDPNWSPRTHAPSPGEQDS